MTAWINLQIHDWFFHNVTDDDPWTLQARSVALVPASCRPRQCAAFAQIALLSPARHVIRRSCRMI